MQLFVVNLLKFHLTAFKQWAYCLTVHYNTIQYNTIIWFISHSPQGIFRTNLQMNRSYETNLQHGNLYKQICKRKQ